MGRYQYKPLIPSTNDVRLVTILPGEFDDPIQVEITHAELVPPAPDDKPKRLPLKEILETLPEDWSAYETIERRVIFWNSVDSYSTWTHPDPTYSREAYDSVAQEDDQPKLRYEALSYTWGSSQSPDTVEVKRSHKHWRAMFTSKLCVNRNLAEAMRYLRYEDRPRVMWIDAICINQADVKERSVQVRRMGQIFSLANRVVAWLGPGFSNSKLAVTTLDYLGRQTEITRDNYGLSSPGCDQPTWFHKNVILPYDDRVDYELSPETVFKEFFLTCSNQDRRFTQLAYAGQRQTIAPESQVPWPTWVPNWLQNLPITAPDGLLFCASGISGTGAGDKCIASDKLEVTALSVGIITSVGDTISGKFSDFAETLRSMQVDQLRKRRYPTGETYLDAYILTFALSQVEERIPQFGYPTLADLREAISVPEASESTLQGDEVFVVLGCDVPMVLRSTPGGEYRVIGNSYVHGINLASVLTSLKINQNLLAGGLSGIPYKPRTTDPGRDPHPEAISATDTQFGTSASAGPPTSQYGLPAHTMPSRREHHSSGAAYTPHDGVTGRPRLSVRGGGRGPASAIAASLHSRPGRNLAAAQHAVADGDRCREPRVVEYEVGNSLETVVHVVPPPPPLLGADPRSGPRCHCDEVPRDASCAGRRPGGSRN
ncbi:hypothetical protein DL768_003351 [Monosporascus sp. mg162]|nr:hypothetical protein DL768_003351 [Monosporascus sp. mg162]